MAQPGKYMPPSIDAKRFNCPHCGAFADHLWFDLHADRVSPGPVPIVATADSKKMNALALANPKDAQKQREHARQLEDATREVAGMVFLTAGFCSNSAMRVANVFLSHCVSCHRASLWLRDCLLHPHGLFSIAPNDDLPDDIKEDFNEARSILDISPRGAAALLRLCIQKLLNHLGVPGDSIDKQISALVSKGLDPQIQQSLDIVRVIGNESVHPGTMDLRDHRDTAEALFDLVNLIAQDRLTRPRMVQEMYERLPQSKRDGIAKRDTQRSGNPPLNKP